MKFSATNLSRRSLLMAGAVFGGAGMVGLFSRLATANEGDTIVVKPGKVSIERFDDAGKSLGVESVDKVIKSEDEWKQVLADAPQAAVAFYVTRQEGTERAFTGPYWDNHEKTGLYRCRCCDNALYDAATKYDSGTGWPSFYQPIAKTNVLEQPDEDGFRTKVSCTLCEAHLGHVFNDGPAPTGLRYCMDGVALRYVPRPAT